MKKVNKNMEYLIFNINKIKCDNIKINPEKLFEILFPPFKEVFDCIVIDYRNEIFEKNLNFDNILYTHYDRTGYEANSNEVRINDFVEQCNINELMKLAEVVIESWKNKLKKEFPNYNFYIIVSVSDENIVLRFHKKRENEPTWLAEDLEKYSEAIMLIAI